MGVSNPFLPAPATVRGVDVTTCRACSRLVAWREAQTERVPPFPIIIVGSRFWKGLMDWVRESMLAKNRCISVRDLDIFYLVDTPEEVVGVLREYYGGNKRKKRGG